MGRTAGLPPPEGFWAARDPSALPLVAQVKLVQHTHSCLYGTFLGNSPCERDVHHIAKRTCSVWSLLRAGNKHFHNLLYLPGSEQVSPLPPSPPRGGWA